jgi:hypothetical protein
MLQQMVYIYVYVYSCHVALYQARLTCILQARCCPKHSIMFPAEMFEETSFSPFPSKTKYNAKAILKNCELFIYGDGLSHFVKCVKNKDTLACVVNWITLVFLFLTIRYPFVAHDVCKNTWVGLCFTCSFVILCVQLLLPACKPNFSEVARTIRKFEQTCFRHLTSRSVKD